MIYRYTNNSPSQDSNHPDDLRIVKAVKLLNPFYLRKNP